METGVNSIADSDHINTSTPWKLRFIKSPVVSTPIGKRVDSGFELFVSGLQDKVSSAENSLNEASEENIQADTIREQEQHPCNDTVDEKTVLPCNTHQESSPSNTICITRSQPTDTLPSAKLWKPVDTSYYSFIVLDETIMSDESNDEDSFRKDCENFPKNISGILPMHETTKLVPSPKFDTTKADDVTILISDESNDETNDVKSRSIISKENVLQDMQNVTSVTTVQNQNENNFREVENNDDMQNTASHSPEVDKPIYVSSTVATVKLEPNATIEQLPENSGKSEQVMSGDEGGDRLEQVKCNNEDIGKIEQIKPDCLKTEQVESDNLDVESDILEIENLEEIKSDSSEIGNLEEAKSDSSEIGKLEELKSDNLEIGNMEQVKSEDGENEKLKSVDEKTEQMKSDNRESGKIEQTNTDNLETGKTEQVKPDIGDFVSSDPEENADNNNPEWELLKKLETDEERYKAVRLRWRNLVIPNPNKNLTYRSRGYWTTNKNQRQVSEVKPNPMVTSRKRTHSADPIEHHVPAKRQRTFSCTEVFDRKMIDIHKNLSRERNAILQQHERAVQNLVNKTNNQLRSYPPGSINDERIRALHVQNVVELRYRCDNRLAAVESESLSQLRTLEKAMEEVRVFNTFYQGLEEGCDDALLLTDEQLVEVLEEDHLYECFAEFYNG